MRTRHEPLSRRTSRGRPDSNRFAPPGAYTRSRTKTWRGRFESTLRNAGSTEQDPGGWTGRPTASVRSRFAAAATLGACSAAAATASISSSVPGSRAARQSDSRLKVVWLWGQYQRAIRVPRGVLRAFGAVTHERASAVRVIRTRSTSALSATPCRLSSNSRAPPPPCRRRSSISRPPSNARRCPRANRADRELGLSRPRIRDRSNVACTMHRACQTGKAANRAIPRHLRSRYDAPWLSGRRSRQPRRKRRGTNCPSSCCA